MSNQDPKYDVNFDHNPLGPLPREDTIQPPIIRNSESASRRAHDARSTETSSSSLENPLKRPHSGYDFDQNFLGSMPEGYVPPETSHSGIANPASAEPFNLAETDNEDTQDVITRLFSGDLDKGDEEQINIQLDPALADQSQRDESSATPGQGSDNGKTQKKRKGSSRINMLTRGGACEFCKRRKLKCTAELPSCSVCLRSGKECVYSQKKQKSRVRTLEDRLVELEKRLDQDKPQGSSSGPTADFVTPSTQPDVPMSFAAVDSNASTTWMNGVDWSFLGLGDQTTLPEPDLMTLADAAAADGTEAITTGSWPWDGLDEKTLATEIVKAVEGEKDIMGERIIGHLLSLYNKATDRPYLHLCLSPSALLRRLATSSPPHPSLLLSILPLLLHLSPSTTLSNPETITYIAKRLETPARLHGLRAYAGCDPRILDVITGDMLRTNECYTNARLVEGWTEHATAVSLVWMTGLGKLGGIDQVLGGNTRTSDEEKEQSRNDGMMQELRNRGVLCRAPTTVEEAGDQISLFWVIYLTTLCGSKSWNMPLLIDEEEITTPFPQASYDNIASLRDHPQTISDFVAGQANTGLTDTGFCASIKGLYLLTRATRLFDIPPSKSTPDKSAQLQRLATEYMASLTPLSSVGNGMDSARYAEAWSALHAATMYLHLKAEIDSPENSKEAEENLDRALEAGARIGQVFDTLMKRDKAMGDVALLSASIWTVVGRTAYKLALRLERLGRGQAGRAVKARGVGRKMMEACRVVGKRLPFARIMAQLMEDISNGIEGKGGEVSREHFAL